MTAPTRRARRTLTPVDPALFRADVEQALRGFASDVSYAVAMARAAVTITRKREVWQGRRDAHQDNYENDAATAAQPDRRTL